MKGSLSLIGAKELDKKLRELEKKVAKQFTRKALRVGAKIIQAEAKARAPVETGALRKSIKVRAGRSRKGRISIRVVSSAGDFKGDQFYGSFLEFGWHQGSRKLANRKPIPAQPFMRPAYESKKEAAANAVVSELKSLIEAEAS